jgi:HAMP domain-containing protein
VKRWWNSTTTTIAATVVAAIVLGLSLQQLVSSGLLHLGLARQQTIEKVNSSLLLQLPGRVATLLDILDATPHADRPAVIAAAQRPQVRLRLLDAPMPNLTNRDEPDADLLRHRIEATLTAPRSVVVAEWYRPPDQQAGTGTSRVKIGVMIETALSDGRWLLFWSTLLPPPAVDPVATQFSRASFAAWLAISVLLGILLSILAARRLVRPLSELATAVEEIGGNGDVPPISPRGTREVQGVILAFNRMRERLRRFNEDRTRMLAAMSHDLRTPLTRLRLRAELVEDHIQQEKMLAELDMMDDMIESMLSFARDDAKHEPRSLVDLSALVEGICQDASDAGEPVTFSGRFPAARRSCGAPSQILLTTR